MKGRTLRFVLVAASSSAVVVLVALSLRGAVAQHSPGTSASNDDEWIQLIDQARRVRSGELPVVLPTPVVSAGTTVLVACAQIPAEVHFSGVSNDPGPLPGQGRTVLKFTDVSKGGDGPSYAMVVDWSQKLGGCDSRVQQMVAGGKAQQLDIDAHICDEMRIAAQGRDLSDKTMRQPSARVARAYLGAFCQ
jgi:hypothetical protein